MALRTVAALVALALLPASAGASSKPNFPKTVTGTINGSYNAKKDGITRKATWVVSGVRFKLVHVRFVENTWTGFYDLTAGTVKFSETKTGPCTHTLNETFALKTALPSRKITTPFSMTRSLTGHDTYGADLTPRKRFKATDTCTFEGSEPTTESTVVATGNLLNTGEKGFKIGRAMKGSYKMFDDFLNETTVWKWSLKPRG